MMYLWVEKLEENDNDTCIRFKKLDGESEMWWVSNKDLEGDFLKVTDGYRLKNHASVKLPIFLEHQVFDVPLEDVFVDPEKNSLRQNYSVSQKEDKEEDKTEDGTKPEEELATSYRDSTDSIIRSLERFNQEMKIRFMKLELELVQLRQTFLSDFLERKRKK